MTQDENQIARNKAQLAEQEADRALYHSAVAEKEASIAIHQSDQAQHQAENAINKASMAAESKHSNGESSEMALNEAKEAIRAGERARVEAEEARGKAEHARIEAESARGKAEQARGLAEEVRNQAETQRSIESHERASAVQALHIAEQSQHRAENALRNALLAKEVAEAAEKTAQLAYIRAEQYIKELENSNKDLEQFAAVVSHDLKSPLRKIKNFSKKIEQDNLSILPSNSLDELRRIQRSIASMEQLIEDLLLLSKIKQGGASLTTDRIILAELIANVQLDLSEQISQTQAQLEVKPLCTVKGNAEQLYQLFYNLIQNALKYQPKGNIPVIQISSQSIDNCCEITIEDNGLGFEQEQAEQIFGIFERLHGKNTYSGTGVGLAICKRIVDRHNGSIRAEGKLGEGARFIVRLPER